MAERADLRCNHREGVERRSPLSIYRTPVTLHYPTSLPGSGRRAMRGDRASPLNAGECWAPGGTGCVVGPLLRREPTVNAFHGFSTGRVARFPLRSVSSCRMLALETQ